MSVADLIHRQTPAPDQGRGPVSGLVVSDFLAALGTREAELLAELTGRGAAVLRGEDGCHWIAHRAASLDDQLTTAGEAMLYRLGGAAPLNVLVAPASEEQARNLHYSDVTGGSVWNVQHVFECDCNVEVDPESLVRAMALVAACQDSLRTRFARVSGRWLQLVAIDEDAMPPPPLDVVEMPDLNSFKRMVGQRRAEPMSVDRGPLLRGWVTRVEGRWYVGFVAHHAIADAFMLSMLFEQVMAAHDGLRAGEEPRLPDVGEQVWQYALTQQATAPACDDAHRPFWRERLAQAPTAMRLPLIRDPADVDRAALARSDSFAVTLPAKLTHRLVGLQQAYGITYTQLFLAALSFLMVRGMGNPVAVLRGFQSRRDRSALFDTLGEFTGVTITPYAVRDDGAVLDLLQETRRLGLEALGHRLPARGLFALAGLTVGEDDKDPEACLRAYWEPRGEVLIDSADLDAAEAGRTSRQGRSLFAEGLRAVEESGVGEEGEAVATLFFQVLKANSEVVMVSSWRKPLFDRGEMEALSSLLIRVIEAMADDPRRSLAALTADFAEDLTSLKARCERIDPGATATPAPAPARRPAPRSRHPQCQLLNDGCGRERPVFWIHGAFGDASVYLPLARRLSRPVYGIQARGLFDEEEPLNGVPRIAAFYRAMILDIQPEGPFDLGGYSIGGTFAYEVARQLQAEGHRVASLTLVDALYPDQHERIASDLYQRLHFAAMGLVALVHRAGGDEPAPAPSMPGRGSGDGSTADRAALITAFAAACRESGVARPKAWIEGYLERLIRVQEGFRIEEYAPPPLTGEVGSARYVRNRGGLFFGSRMAFMNAADRDPLDGVDFWSGWRALLPGLTEETVAVDNHIEMLADEAVLDVLCRAHQETAERAPEPEAISDAAAPEVAGNGLERYLAEVIAETLGIERSRLDPRTRFETLALDSLAASEIAARLQTDIDPAVSITLLFDCATPAALASRLRRDHADAVTRAGLGSASVAPSPSPAARSVTPDRSESTAAAGAGSDPDAVAIIGVSGRYPGARDLEAYWRILRDGIDCVREIPPERWDWTRHYDPDRIRPGAHHSKWGGFIDDVDRFDSLFFNISPREAEIMDPQERLFLECSWAALEDAGLTRADLRRVRADGGLAPVSVYAGVMYGEYQFLGVESSLKGAPSAVSGSYAGVANRVSYALDLHGPSLSVDTACSSSLTAIHLACRDLRDGESDLAIAGGVNLSLHPNKYRLLSNGAFLSEKGRCESFGLGGGGFIPAEGVGALVLKRLSDAERDGDRILGVVLASAVNHGGRTNGYTVPNSAAQSHVIRRAIEGAGVDPAWISYVEAHGTGTKIGDPIEIAGLTDAFATGGARTDRCWIGSAKSNLGHCEAAAGIAGLTKVLLQMREGAIAPSLHADVLNPHIDFGRTPFEVNRVLRPWERPLIDGVERPRIAGVSSFGAGGANAHLLVGEYPAANAVSDPCENAHAGAPEMIVLSARRAEQLTERARDLRAWIDDAEAAGRLPALADVAHTLQVGREAMTERLALSVETLAELRTALDSFITDPSAESGLHRGQARDGDADALPFTADEELDRAVQTWAARGKWDRILALWVRGYSVDWRALPAGGRRRKIGLPTYPFARERHWIEPAAVDTVTPEEGAGRPAVLMAAPEWRPAPLASPSPPTEVDHGHATRRLILFLGGAWADRAAAIPDGVAVSSEHSDEGERIVDLLVRTYGAAKAFLEHRDGGSALLQCVVAGDAEGALLAAVSGLVRTLRRERPDCVAQAISVVPNVRAEALAELLSADACAPNDIRIDHAAGDRRVLALREITDEGGAARAPWRDGGVYLITGGLGGLGLIFARAIAAGCASPVLVLVGRSQPGEAGRDTIRELEAMGARVLCRQADVGRREDVDALVADLVRDGYPPTAVLHAAGIIRDNYMVKKTPEQFASVLRGKMLGCVHLDRATRTLPLDLFVLFSSAAGILGNAGQSDYASANAFLDTFAARRDAQVKAGERQGRTLSIGWPLWRDGGMTVKGETLAAIERASGIRPMATATGLDAFARMLDRPESAIMIVEGDRARLRSFLFGANETTVETAKGAGAGAEAGPGPTAIASIEAVRTLLADLFGPVVKLPPERVDFDERLDVYGLDSVMVTQLNERLEKALGPVSKTLFFEHKRLEDIARHLQRAMPEASAQPAASARESTPVGSATPALRPPDITREAVRATDEPIAIIGMSGHYPMAETLAAFWDNLKAGRDCVREIPPERWSLDGFYEPDPRRAVETGRSYCKWGGFLDGFERFDPFFFKISPREARAMDPQERWLLRAAWEAMEDAGHTRQSLASLHGGRVGVFAGVTSTGFDLHGPALWRRGETLIPRTSFSSFANRISYVLDLSGPSMAIDTMCSSSLTALHEACEQLRRGTCEAAFLGAVNIYCHPASYRGLSANRMLASDGRCKSFGAGGDGFVPGEGAGALLLKPLSQAEADGDPIHAVVLATSVNHGGRTNGYTVPNPVAQSELIAEALTCAGVDARSVGYFEAHGTGTELGDPIEVAGMTKAFQRWTDDTGFCAVGSVKSNLGHLEAAAGLAGLTKIVLQMRHATLVPSLHAETLNPKIDFAASPFVLQRQLAPWDARGPDGERRPRIACLSSFGAGGANAHAVLREYPAAAAPAPGDSAHLLPLLLSARDGNRLTAMAAGLAAHLASDDGAPPAFADMAFTLARGRESMAHRLGFVARSVEEARRVLADIAEGRDPQGVHRGVVAAGERPDALPESESDPAGGDLQATLAHWVRGGTVDWDRVEWARGMERAARRISLPTYPFAGERYWFENHPEPDTAPANASGANADRPNAWDGISYRVLWDRLDPAPVIEASDPISGAILVWGRGHPDGLAAGLAERLARRRPQARVIRLDPDAAETEGEAAIAAAGTIAALYAVADGAAPVADALALLRLVARVRGGPAGMDVYLLGDEALGDAGWVEGAGLALAQSRPDVRLRNLRLRDLDPLAGRAREGAAFDALLTRIAAEPPSRRGEVVRLGPAMRERQVYLPLLWPAPTVLDGLRKGGRYLILGGAGAVGQAVTRALINQYGARVAWIGRRPADHPDIVAARSAFTADTRPLYVQADALDATALGRAVRGAVDDLGVLDGAFFAGKDIRLEDRPDDFDAARFTEIVDIKTRGVRNFHAALAPVAPSFVCHFSSAQAYAFLPAGESVSYAVAIAMADRLVATLAETTPYPVGILNWGYWDAGLSGSSVADTLSRHFRFLSDADAMDVLDRFVGALRAGMLDQALCVGVRDTAARLMPRPADEGVRLAPLSVGADWRPPVGTLSRPPDRPVVSAAERDALEQHVAALLGSVLRGCERDRASEKFAPLLAELDRIVATAPEPIADQKAAWATWTAYRASLELPELRAAADLSESCLLALPDVLAGRIAPTEAVFPDGSDETVEALYRRNGLSDHFNDRLAETLAGFLRTRTGPTRLLEIGAGTGSTTAAVLDRLVAEGFEIAEYAFTDIGGGFLAAGRQRFGERLPAMRFERLDITRPVEAQGIAPGAYDAVIATNVLHATPDIRRTLRNAKALLARGGLLLLNEVTRKSNVATVTFGLLDGWWGVRDAELRLPGAPLLDLAGFWRAMTAEGVRAVAGVTGGAASLGQEVIAGVSDGLIRQPIDAIPAQAPMSPDVDRPASIPAPTSAPAPALAPTPASTMETADAIEARLRTILVDVLGGGGDTVARDVAFSDYGVDSILGVSFIDRVNDALGLALNATILFERSSLRALALHIASAHGPSSVAVEPSRAEDEDKGEGAEAIAVVGYAGRFPGASDVEDFWRLLNSGRAAVGSLPDSFTQVPGGYRWGSLLDGRDAFDPLFFDIAPREAASMNRHQRLVLQEGWRALEHAGRDPLSLKGSRTGVFIGAEPAGGFGESFTGASDAIIASRLSYFLGLRGTALVVNTGCSSSGVVISLACRDLLSGESDLALAGGVSASLEPTVLAALAETGMLSPTGRCLSFDARADGTVLSEGVAMVVLKRLSDARSDGDTIHGVILASATNQDGASNGITAPSGEAQEALIVDLYRRHGIDPRRIAFVEAHGTGTALGDPVEANALTRAFAQFIDERGVCPVASAKAHIGHTSAASGAIGLIKALLSLRHRRVPAMPGFERLNPRIDLSASALDISGKAVPLGGGDDGPLLAAVSSFGHSGTNAHLVLAAPETGPYLADGQAIGSVAVPLSARTPDRLAAVARSLRDALSSETPPALLDVAHTLQTGRAALEERALFTADSIDDLMARLDRFLAGQDQGADGSDVDPIAARWLAGETVEWPAIAGAGRAPRRVPLPGYPFRPDSHPPRGAALPTAIDQTVIGDPMIGAPAACLDGARFETVLTGAEDFLADHRVGGRPVMPGVGYLEMARAAAARLGLPGPIRLEDVVWERQFAVEGAPKALRVTLRRAGNPDGAAGSDDGRLAFEIEGADGAGGWQVHASGHLRSPPQDTSHGVEGPMEGPPADARPVPGAPDLSACRAAFEALDIGYGSSFRTIETLEVVDIGGDVAVVSTLACSETGPEDAAADRLHVGLMDGALQSAMALTLLDSGGALPRTASLPFALETVDIFAPLPKRVRAVVRRAPAVSARTEALDIALYDPDGAPLVRMRGLCSRTMEGGLCDQPSGPESGCGAVPDPARPETNGAPEEDEQDKSEQDGVRLLAPVWSPVGEGEIIDAPADAEARVLVVGGTAEMRAKVRGIFPHARHLDFRAEIDGQPVDLRLSGPVDHIVWLAPPTPGFDGLIGGEIDDGAPVGEAFSLFALVKALIRADLALNDLCWTILTERTRAYAPGDPVDPSNAAVLGLAGSMAKEFPHWRVRVLDLDNAGAADPPLSELNAIPFDPGGGVRLRRGGLWYRETLVPCVPAAGGAPAFRADGVYLVIGGAGGLGAAWTRSVAERFGARVTWIGRRPRDAEIDRQIASVAAVGPAPDYIQADAADPAALAAVRDQILARFGRIDGVVHSALALQDRTLVSMSPEAFREGLRPKVDAGIALARAFAEIDLDFVLFFSSLQSVTMAAGQSNYAAGCTFIDSLAEALRGRWRCAVKVMNWGYWGSVGAVADDANRQRMAHAGLASIEPSEGMAALDALMNGGFDRMAALKPMPGRALPLINAASSTDERLVAYRSELPRGMRLLVTS